MCRWFNLLLLLCFIKYSEISGNTPRSVTGEEGGNVTLRCNIEPRHIVRVILISQSKPILDCQNEECKRENSRLLKNGSCDVIIKNLTFSDAGKYILRVHYTDDQQNQEHHLHLHIHAEITVEIGKPLKLDVLLTNADRVEKNSSGEWTEVWTRGHGVRSDRLTVRDQTLTNKAFTSTDSGTYRVLDSEGDTMITVTVTASNTGSEGKLDTDEDKTNAVEPWIIVLSVIGALVVLVIFAVIWKYKRQNRKPGHEVVPMKKEKSRTSRDDTVFL